MLQKEIIVVSFQKHRILKIKLKKSFYFTLRISSLTWIQRTYDGLRIVEWVSILIYLLSKIKKLMFDFIDQFMKGH